ncbi:hypothetical protein Q7C18_02895 [Nesterenkonia sp. CL21]|uniref:hypothetical protein n=1 Tax=Nesterenkonia sp. CL21 TaxID=3064894 RepID=UPI00287B3491|nr:hypothetical protein [Nesterenkonia sp. CL21]MDS2171635.1 hypothetical protein [Nesterenkonia sp. CL21]
MRINVGQLHAGNIGQTVTIDTYDDLTNEESVVTGILEGIERDSTRSILTVAGDEFPLALNDSVDIVRSMVLDHLVRTEHQVEGAIREVIRDELPGLLRETLRDLLVSDEGVAA